MSAGLPLLLLALRLAADAAPPPATMSAPAAAPVPVAGFLAREAIRGVIESHINEVKYCYERDLVKMPDLFGEVWVRFTVADSGEVIDSVALERSTTNDSRVESCTAAAVQRWRFPKPSGGGTVIVTYPLVFTPSPKPIPIVSPKDGTSSFDITVLDAHAIVHRSTNAQGIPSNGLVVLTDRGLLLVDTAWTEAQTEAILTWGDRRLGRPWIGAVITHDHPDRDGGLGALRRRHIPVAALDLTVAKLAKRGVRGVTTLFKARDREFKDPRGFQAFYPGPGHTTDNIVLSFPNVLFAGCLLKSTEATDLGFTGDADLAHWPEAVERLAQGYEEEEMPVVPGHGAVDMTSGIFQHTLDLLAAARKK